MCAFLYKLFFIYVTLLALIPVLWSWKEINFFKRPLRSGAIRQRLWHQLKYSQHFIGEVLNSIFNSNLPCLPNPEKKSSLTAGARFASSYGNGLTRTTAAYQWLSRLSLSLWLWSVQLMNHLDSVHKLPSYCLYVDLFIIVEWAMITNRA